jgi:prepilin-type N-terminal cleavage/methylation domain-containing protein
MKKNIPASRQGFTLIELVVTISIFVVVSTLIFANYPKFKSQLSLKKTSQEIAFAVREAQVYSLSVKSYDNTFNFGYGVHFDKSKPNTIVLFADTNNNNVFDEESDGNVKEYKIQTNNAISDLCGDEKKSFPNPGLCGLSQLDAVYLRPNPIVNLKRNGDPFSENFSDIEIIISSPGEVVKKIIIWVSGQITIE